MGDVAAGSRARADACAGSRMNESALVLPLAYGLLYVALVYRAQGSRVGWLSSLLCLSPALYISYSTFGATHDGTLIVELVESAKRGTSPWEVSRSFDHPPGYPVLLTPIAWMSRYGEAAAFATKVKVLNLVFLVWFGWMGGEWHSPRPRTPTGVACCISPATRCWSRSLYGTFNSTFRSCPCSCSR